MMGEEKNVNEKEEIKIGKNPPLKKWKKVLGLIVITLVSAALIAGIVVTILFGDELNNKNNKVIDNVSNVYRFSGELLFSKAIGNHQWLFL